MQSKKQSFIEASTNTVVGFVISYASTFIIFPLMGFESSASKNIVITLFFTVVSVLRSYYLRRYFNQNKVSLKQKAIQLLLWVEDLSSNCPRETKW